MLNPLTYLTAAGRRRHRYVAIERLTRQIRERLSTSADPAQRAELITALARIEAELARRHTAAWGPDPIHGEGGRDEAESRAAAAELLTLLADTERAVAAARWTRGQDLRAGDQVWHEGGWRIVTLTMPGILPNMIHAEVDDGDVLVYSSDEPVRTGGPPVIVRGDGLTADELALWFELAATADRMARCRLLDRIFEYAAERVGDQAAQTLSLIIGTEGNLAHRQRHGVAADLTAAAPPRRRLWITSRFTATAAVFLVALAVFCAVPTLSYLGIDPRLGPDPGNGHAVLWLPVAIPTVILAVVASAIALAAAWRRLTHRNTSTMPGGQRPVCDNASVGVIITRQDGKYLVFDRNTFPPGVAPAAGHVFDEHDDYESAAHAEVAEELGLTVTSLTYLTGGWRPNRCRRAPGPRGIGHQWRVYLATVTGQINASPRETRNVRWLTAGELTVLAERTICYAHGHVTDAEFAADPGIEPVWVTWLSDAGIVTVPAEQLPAVDRLATAGGSSS